MVDYGAYIYAKYAKMRIVKDYQLAIVIFVVKNLRFITPKYRCDVRE